MKINGALVVILTVILLMVGMWFGVQIGLIEASRAGGPRAACERMPVTILLCESIGWGTHK